MQRLKACAFDGSSPRSHMIRVITGSRPGAFGLRISPVKRRLRNTAPSGAWSPIFSATWRKPSGVVIRPQSSPSPNLEVEIGKIASRSPLPISISFWSLTLMMTRLGPSARRPGASASSAISTRDGRNMSSFLLDFRLLSRGNCGRGRPLASEIPSRHPLTERGKGNVEEPNLEHGQERNRDELAVLNREPNEVGKIKREGHLGEGKKRFERHVLAGTPGLGLSLDPIFRGAGEVGFVI